MNDFESFNLNKNALNHENTELNNEKKEYHFVSELGDFSHAQDRILRFGKSDKMVRLLVLIYLSFLIQVISSVIVIFSDLTYTDILGTHNYNWMKLLYILVLGIGLITPLATTKIYLGCRNSDTLPILRGITMLQSLLSLSFILLFIVAIIVGIAFLFLLFSSFILVVILGAMSYGVFYLFFNYLKKARTFLEEVSYVMSSNTHLTNDYPTSSVLKPYLVAFAIFSIVGWILDLVDPSSSLNGFGGAASVVLSSNGWFSNVTFLVSIFTSIIVISLTDKFDEFIRIGKPTIYDAPIVPKKDNTQHPIIKRDVEDEDWKLKL